MDFNDVFSITFGDQAENNIGMEKIGNKAESGFSLNELKEMNIGEVIDLSKNLPKNFKKQDVGVLIIKNGVDLFLGKDKATELYLEQKKLPFDKKALFRGKVKNKLARWNLCYSDYHQEPDYEKGKGTVINFSEVPILNSLREKINNLSKKSKNLQAELNFYYDLKKTGIGFHGDTERKIVICARLGASMNLHYQWFFKFKPVGERLILDLDHGDIYIMSEKAVGKDWKKSSIPTLRHAAGSIKYTTIK